MFDVPDFLSPLPVSYFIQISTHVYIHSSVGAWTPESQRHALITAAAPTVPDDCLCGTTVSPPQACSLLGMSGQCRCAPQKEQFFFLSMLISFQFKQWHLGAPWSCTVAEGTATQRSLKIWEGQLSVRDQMSGMEWGCKTIYGGLWLLCKHGRDERTENRGGQKSHDSETGGGVRIRKAVMITDQSQTPEAGARQVVYTHMHTHRRTHTKQVNVHLHTCYKFAARRRHFHSYWMGRQNLQFNLQNLKPI